MNRYPIRTRLFAVGAFIIFVGLLHWSGLSLEFEKKIFRFFSQILINNTGLNITVNDKFRLFTNKDEFLNAAQLCFENETDNELAIIELKKISDENEELRQILKFSKNTPDIPLLANVVSRDLSSNDQVLIIDKGSADGVEIGMPVIFKEGIFIGSIIKTNESTSAIRLLNDNSSKIAVSILNIDRSIGVLEGGFGISLKIRFIPRNEIIRSGDKVITSGLEETIPRGLAIGTITVVENEAYQPFQEAVVKPLNDLSKINIVGILTKMK